MFNLFGSSNPSQADNIPSPIMQRLLNVLEQYQREITLPPMVTALLSPFLSKLNSLSDEQILSFVGHMRQLLTYVETGELHEGHTH